MNFQPWPSFVGQQFQAAALRAAAEQTVNLYPEAIPAANGKGSQLILYRTPGLAQLQTLGDRPARGSLEVNGRVFVVAGGSFIELTDTTHSTVRGSLNRSSSTAADLSTNGLQVEVVADGLIYCFTLATNAWTWVTGQAGAPLYAVGLVSIDGYFITFDRGTGRFSLSGLFDGTTYSGLDVEQSQQPDNIRAIAQCQLYLWIFGNRSIVIFQDTGNTSNAFQRVPGAALDQGCGARLSVCNLDNTLFWLGDDSRGPAVVYRAEGFIPQAISTDAMEAELQSYGTRSDAIAYAYQENGHPFYVLTFPTAGKTWAYDVQLKMWHKRGYWNSAAATYGAVRGVYHVFGFNTHLVFDSQGSGAVYAQSTAYATDAGAPIRWLRAAPHINDAGRWIFYNALQVQMQTGGGLPDPTQTPAVMLRFSDDGGFNWSDYRAMSSGKLGEYALRVVARRLGRSRTRVFEVSGSDAIPQVCLVSADLDMTPGTS